MPFQTGADFSVFDHPKCMEVTSAASPVPERGSLEFAADIKADTPGTVARPAAILVGAGPLLNAKIVVR